MAYTGANIITEVLSRNESYNSTTYGAGDLQKAHDWVNRMVRLYARQTEDFLMVADQLTYTYDADTLLIHQAMYFTSADDEGRVLMAVSEDQLDQDFPGWETNASGTPAYYCDRAGQLILYPAPNASSSGGYPLVRIYTTQTVTFTTGTSLPAYVKTIEPWVNYILYLDAMRFNPSTASAYEMVATQLVQSLKQDQQRVTYRKKPRVRQRMTLNQFV